MGKTNALSCGFRESVRLLGFAFSRHLQRADVLVVGCGKSMLLHVTPVPLLFGFPESR